MLLLVVALAFVVPTSVGVVLVAIQGPRGIDALWSEWGRTCGTTTDRPLYGSVDVGEDRIAISYLANASMGPGDEARAIVDRDVTDPPLDPGEAVVFHLDGAHARDVRREACG